MFLYDIDALKLFAKMNYVVSIAIPNRSFYWKLWYLNATFCDNINILYYKPITMACALYRQVPLLSKDRLNDYVWNDVIDWRLRHTELNNEGIEVIIAQ